MSISVKCPFCGLTNSEIMDKRLSIGGYTDVDFYVWRRRRCLDCGKRYTTLEMSIPALDKLTGKVKENGDGG